MIFVLKCSFAERCDDGEVGGIHAGSHEEDEVLVASPPVDGHVILERLQGGLGAIV